MNLLKNLHKPFTLLLLLLTVIGCAAPNVSNKTTREKLVATNKALLVFSMTQPLSSEQYGHSVFRFYREGAMSGAIHAQTHNVTGLTPNPKSEFPNFYGRVAAIEVPAGEYQVDSTFNTGNGYYSVRGKTKKNTIQVKAGEVVYVGALNVKLTFGQSFLGVADVKQVEAEIADQRARDIPLFKQKYPALGEPEIRLFGLGPIVGEGKN